MRVNDSLKLKAQGFERRIPAIRVKREIVSSSMDMFSKDKKISRGQEAFGL